MPTSSSSGPAVSLSNSSDAHAVANIIPTVARALLGLVQERGLSPERLCRGLGFHYQDLQDQRLLLSHQQTRTLILRAQKLLGSAALGLAAGARQTPVSWGLVGLAMLTSETFGEAVHYGLSYQLEIGSMTDYQLEVQGAEFCLEVTPHLFDSPIESYLLEEAFAGAVAVGRHLVGPDYKPLRVEFAFGRTGPSAPYNRIFKCPVRFEAGANRLIFSSHWLDARLSSYDSMMSGVVRQQINSLLKRPEGRNDLVESVANHIRFSQDNLPKQADLAHKLNVSERTLRRRLGDQAEGYRELRDTALCDRARDLLENSTMPVAQVAQFLGYSDARAFRRAFQRWSGLLPTEYRLGRLNRKT